MSAVEVHGLVAERNELRFQLQKACAALRKVEAASGGHNIDVVKMSQADMERVAQLKSQIELEQEQLRIRLETAERELVELKDLRRTEEMQVKTLEEQLAERSSAVLELERLNKGGKDALETLRRGLAQEHGQAVEEQRKRLEAQFEHEKRAFVERAEKHYGQERFKALEMQREELEMRHGDILDTKLSEQRHAILAEAAEQRAAEIAALQHELHARETANIEHAKATANEEKQRTVRALKQQHATIQERLQQELDRAAAEGEATRDRDLTDQRRKLKSELNGEKEAALSELKAQLSKKHNHEMEKLRDTLVRKHQDELSSKLAKQQEKQKKALQAQFSREKVAALEAQKTELTTQKTREMKQMQTNLKQKHELAMAQTIKKSVEDDRKRTTRTTTQTQAQVVEKLTSEFRAEKTKALRQQRENLQEKHHVEHVKLVEKMEKMRAELDKLRTAAHEQASNKVQDAATTRRGRNRLKEKLRGLQNSMKMALAPRVESLDMVAPTSSAGLSSLGSLIHALGLHPVDLSSQPAPSPAAESSPPVTVDLLLGVGEELCSHLNAANEQLKTMDHQLQRQKKLVMKQVEEDLQGQHAAELETLRVQMLRDRDFEYQNALKTLQFEHERELQEERKAMEDYVHTLKLQNAASHTMNGTANGTAGPGAARLKATQREVQTMTKRINSQEQVIVTLRRENEHLAEQLHLRQASPGSSRAASSDRLSSGLSSTTSPKPQHELAAEVQRLQQQQRVVERERMRLELTVANLRTQLARQQ